MSDEAVVIDAKLEAELSSALNGGERTHAVSDMTRRALTLRAKKVSTEDIAKAEQVEVSTLEAWLASSRRAPTAEEAEAMMRDEIRPLAIENTKHLLLAGNPAVTREVMKDVLRPKKTIPSKTTILVGVGTGPVGSDPLKVAIAIQHK